MLSVVAAACGAVPHLQLQHRLLPWKALCSLTKGVWNKLNTACPLTAARRTGCSHRRVFPSERDVFSLLPTCGNGRLNYRGSSTLRKCCGWMAASYVAASPHTNNLLLPLALQLMWALLGLPSGSAGGTQLWARRLIRLCRGARAAPGASLHCRCAQKEFCCLLLFQISSGQGMGTCTGTGVSPSLQRSSGSAGDSVAQCGLQGSAVCKPLGCSSMEWGRTSLLSAEMCDAAPLTVVEVWETFPYPSAKLSHGNTPLGERRLWMWLCRKSRLEGWYRGGGCQLTAIRTQILG